MKAKKQNTTSTITAQEAHMKPILDVADNFTPTRSDLARIVAAERNFQLDPAFWETATTPGTDLVWKRNGSTFEIVTRRRQPIFKGAVHNTQKSVEIGAIEKKGYKIF